MRVSTGERPDGREGGEDEIGREGPADHGSILALVDGDSRSEDSESNHGDDEDHAGAAVDPSPFCDRNGKETAAEGHQPRAEVNDERQPEGA